MRNSAPTYTEDNLNGMTKAEIEALAIELGVEGVSVSQTKAEMIETFLANYNG
jgi:hypothetical protein